MVGLELVREARKLTDRPLVAIGGINLGRAPEVIASGADCVAVISALYPLPEKVDLGSKPEITFATRTFLEILKSEAIGKEAFNDRADFLEALKEFKDKAREVACE